jgi:CubicO group peptidase (beta-lactamase class C family)
MSWRAWTAVAVLLFLPEALWAAAISQPDLEAFFDGVLSQRLERDDLAGAAVAVVQDGAVVFEKGYGYADVAKKIPVSAQETVFGIASISKTFTATAVMQLVAAGQLDLDVDVDRYLDFELVKAFPEPVTLRRLLTHTAGFEEGGKDDLDDPRSISKLGPFLATHQPAQIFRPGTRIAYSNYGNSLAGYVVERVAKQPFAEYIERHIYQPLGMQHSTYEAPLPPGLAALATQEYWRASQPPRPIEYLTRRPAGGMFTTADDMAKYMIMHLQGDQRVLPEDAARAMYSIQWRAHPNGPGIAMAFYQGVGNGRFVLTHGGDLACQHSDLWLIPREHLGVFLIFNTTGTDWTRIRGSIWKAFVDRYLPPTAPLAPTVKADIRPLVGSYLATRRIQTGFLSITSYLQPTRVTGNTDGSLSMEGATDYSGTPKKYFPSGDLLFRESDGHTLGFIRGQNGTIVAMIADGVAEFEREQGVLSGRTQALLLLLSAAIIILSLTLWPIAALVRWRYHQPLRNELDAQALRRKWIVRGTVTVALVMIILAGTYLAALAKLEFQILSASTDPYIRLFQLLSLLLIIGSGHALWSAAMAWKRREGAWSHRLGMTLTSCALAVMAVFILSYHCLAIRLAY